MSVEIGAEDGDSTGDTISVIYVDDYEGLCSLTADSLEEASDRISVTTTTDPTRVTDRLEEFDCIVSDYEMPDVDGLELLRQVRVLDEDVPFILYTGEGSENVASDAISLGVTDYMTKTGGRERFDRLANRIEGAVRANRASEAVERTKTEAREAIERERARFRALIEHSPAMTAVLNTAGELEYLSPSVEDMTGYSPRELRGEVAFDYVHEDDRTRVVDEFKRSLSNPEYRPTVTYRFRHASGEWLHLETTGVNRLDDPAVEGFVVNTRDVTEQKRTEARLRRERDISGRILEATPTPVILVDGNGRVLRSNRRGHEVFDMSREQLIGLSPEARNVEFRTPEGDPIPPEELLSPPVEASTQRCDGVEYHLRMPTGTFRVVLSAEPLSDPDRERAVISFGEVERI